MNPNSRFLKEAQELEKRWANSSLSQGMTKSSRSAMGVMLECERLHNETGTWDCCDECRERERQEKGEQK